MAEPEPGAPRLTCLGKLLVLLFALACVSSALYLMQGQFRAGGGGTRPAPGGGGAAANPARDPAAPAVAGSGGGEPAPAGSTVEIGFAYGTEKERWLRWAVDQFAQSKEGRGVKVNLVPLGSLEAVETITRQDDQAKRVNLWSPASSAVKEVFVQEWQARTGRSPILDNREDLLALTPLVFVLWAERYEAFKTKYPEVSFRTVGAALAEPGGWNAIANQPDWGVFKFGHTYPRESNSGLMTLVLMALDYHHKKGPLENRDILDPGFVAWMGKFENAVSGWSNSTGNQMRDMVLRGPSTYDGLCVYESVAIDYLKNAEGRWGELRVVYPETNVWNDNPCYVLDVDWSTREQRAAAKRLRDFLLTEPVQRQALVHGFRPGNVNVPVKFPDSPFTVYAKYGLRPDPPVVNLQIPAEVVNNLLATWQRTQGQGAGSRR